MEELVRQLMGRTIDVTCGTTAVFRGEVMDVSNGVLQLRDEDEKILYIAVAKIASVYECSDSTFRPGFIS